MGWASIYGGWGTMSRTRDRKHSDRRRVRQRGLPVVHWLRICTATAGMGLALAAAPAVAFADDGGGTGHSGGSARAQSTAAAAGTAGPAKAGGVAQKAPGARRASVAAARPSRSAAAPADRKTRTAAAAIPNAADTASASTASEPAPAAAAATGHSVRVAAAVPAITAQTRLAAASCSTCGISSIAVGIEQFLASAATWLAGFPANPITDALQGGIWLIRRTLFPASVGVITAPIQIPLQLVEVCPDGTDSAGNCKGSVLQRVGIYAALGSGNPTPQFFEFDTGAAGFHAAYASDPATASPWWGSSGVTTGEPITKSFDSGAIYQGVEATTTVSFFASLTSSTPLLTTANVKVGQMDQISVVKDGKTEVVWDPAGSVDGKPPVDDAFYGDFGAAPSYEGNGISNLLNELTFARGVLPGYRIHVDADTGQSWLQIGLTEADVADSTGLYFAMNPDSSAPGAATAPNSNTRYYAPQLFQATITIVDGSGAPLIADTNVGITPDTGADTTLHNTDRSSSSSAVTYAGITISSTDDSKKGHLESGLGFSLSGTTTTGSQPTYFQFVTDPGIDGGRVNVQNATSAKEVYYLNTGISLFLENDVVYSMGNASGGGTLGLIPHPIQ